MILGCIGDDFTGSSDLASTLAKGGMRVTQYSGIPTGLAHESVEAGVVSLKSRTIAPEDAVRQSLKALDWLLEQGCHQIFFKYCSTFDSTKDGNIGPVADALADRLGENRVVVCPAFPATGRSVYQGHLFVNDALLNESGMQNHPLTPMIDADLRRWLAPQSKRNIAHVPASVVMSGADAIGKAFDGVTEPSLIVVDAISDNDLFEIGTAASGHRLVTGGSGIALGLPANFRKTGMISENTGKWQGENGAGVILSGSCSIATRGQIALYAKSHPTFEITADDVVSGATNADVIANWLLSKKDSQPLAYSSADPEVVKEAQDRHGRETIAGLIEEQFADVARKLVAGGITKLITAGGETSGAIVEGLGITALEIGPEIDPGVPAVRATGDVPLVLALKSGNFGANDFFEKALKVLGDA
ncbi:hypothetical protein A9Q96_12490 [Rhodobacterales bacterium 52_120_T64]|nr:hypothetical protein A9Q96_12490 [Rhodobacterales bacterium 52_120_T64]